MSDTKLYTTLPVDPNNGWQATSKHTGHWAQYAVTGPHTWAVRVEYPTLGADHPPTTFHGPWDLDRARRFAASCGCGKDAQPVEVAPYYYCEAWGKVPADSVGPLDPARANDWSAPLRAGQVLGSDEYAPRTVAS